MTPLQEKIVAIRDVIKKDYDPWQFGYEGDTKAGKAVTWRSDGFIGVEVEGGQYFQEVVVFTILVDIQTPDQAVVFEVQDMRDRVFNITDYQGFTIQAVGPLAVVAEGQLSVDITTRF